MDYSPVLGVDGKVYPNACAAGCAGVKVIPVRDILTKLHDLKNLGKPWKPGKKPPMPIGHPPIPWSVTFTVSVGNQTPAPKPVPVKPEPVKPEPKPVDPDPITKLCPADLPPGAVC